MSEWRMTHGDALEQLRLMPTDCIDCVVTSPPYWRARTYGVAGELGLEPTLHEFVDRLAVVFDEVLRVLRQDGTCWIVIGDSYVANRTGSGGTRRYEKTPLGMGGRRGLRVGQLAGVPWRVAFALQERGWFLRIGVVWWKPNGKPESVRNRPTLSHEFVFMLTKTMRYHYDADAVAEPLSEATKLQVVAGYQGRARKDYTATGAENPSTVKSRIIAGLRKRALRGSGNKERKLAGAGMLNDHVGYSFPWSPDLSNLTRNRRSVWRVPTCRAKGNHTATFPEALVEPCVLAGCPVGGTVLDPFCGTGTTGAVALRHGRSFVGIELHAEHVATSRRRLAAVQAASPLFTRSRA